MTEIPTPIQNFTRDFGPVRSVILVIRCPPHGLFESPVFPNPQQVFEESVGLSDQSRRQIRRTFCDQRRRPSRSGESLLFPYMVLVQLGTTIFCICGAGGIRTLMEFPPADFKLSALAQLQDTQM